MISPEQAAQSGDGALAKRAQSGDRRAYNILMERHGPRIMNIAVRTMGNHADAEDAMQDAMASAWLKLNQYDLERPFAPWLSRIALNKCRDHLRRRKLTRIFDLGDDNSIEQLPSNAPGEHEKAQSRQMLAALTREIPNIPTKLREAFVLVTFDGMSQASAADLLGVTEKTIETRIYRARKRLRGKLKKFEG